MNWLWIVLALLASQLPANAGVAALRNPSFEEARTNGPDQAVDWNRWGAWFNRETVWTPIHSGAAILGYHHFRIEIAEPSGAWQDVQGVRAGQRFTFRIWANADGAEKGKKNVESVELRLESTVDQAQVTLESKTYRAEDLATGNAWSQLSVTGTAAANNLRVLVIVQPSAEGPRDGALKFDDASIERVAPIPGSPGLQP